MKHWLLILALTPALLAGDLARRPNAETRWASFENLAASKGQGGRENQGAKGHAFDSVQPGETRELLNARGSGEIRRIWLTIRDRDPEMLRGLVLNMYWDGAATPARSMIRRRAPTPPGPLTT